MVIKKIIWMMDPTSNRNDLSESAKQDILKNKDAWLRMLLEIDKIEDFNENEEIMKNNKRKIKPILHSKIAENFELYDFVIFPDKVISLYWPDITSKILF